MLKRLLPRSLLGRTVLIIVTPVVLLQVIVGVVFFDRHLESVSQKLARGVINDITYVQRGLKRQTDPDAAAAYLFDAGRQLDLNFAWHTGERLALRPLPTTISLAEITFIETLQAGLTAPFTLENRPEVKTYVLRLGLADGVFEVRVPYYRARAGFAGLLVLWTVGSSLLLVTIAIIFLRNQVRPIRKLADAADRFGKGQEVDDFKPAGAAEVRQAAIAFLRMHDRIHRQIRQRTEMLAGVSHDLRTPLTRMKLALAMLGDSAEIGEMKADVEDMERMIEGYLAFARGADGETAVATDVGALLQEVVADAQREGAAVDLSLDGPLKGLLRPQSLKRCLANLVDNARKYADRIQIAAVGQPGSIEITVDDDGPGIPADEREAVFRPFHRLDTSRNPETGGVGLGLAIARDTARIQGGDIVLGDAPTGGLRATLRLPV